MANPPDVPGPRPAGSGAAPPAPPPPPETGRGEEGKSVLEWLKPVFPLIPLLGMIGGAFWYGHELGEKRADLIESCLKEKQTFLEDQLKDLKEKSQETKKEFDQAQQAIPILKNDLTQCKDTLQSGERAPAAPHPAVSTPGEAEVQVISGETAKVFSRQLFVTLSAIEPSPTAPPRYQAFATLGVPGRKSEDFHGYAGQSTQFAGFEIRITQVDAASARFHIRKLSPAATATP